MFTPIIRGFFFRGWEKKVCVHLFCYSQQLYRIFFAMWFFDKSIRPFFLRKTKQRGLAIVQTLLNLHYVGTIESVLSCKIQNWDIFYTFEWTTEEAILTLPETLNAQTIPRVYPTHCKILNILQILNRMTPFYVLLIFLDLLNVCSKFKIHLRNAQLSAKFHLLWGKT